MEEAARVCSAPGQFSTVRNGHSVTERTDYSDEAVIRAVEWNEAGDDPNVLFFNCIGYGMGEPYGRIDGNYFTTMEVQKRRRKMSNLEKAKTVIKENFKKGDCGLFNTCNTAGDQMTTIYEEGGLQIDICYHSSYFEVFGLSDSEFYELFVYYNHLQGGRR